MLLITLDTARSFEPYGYERATTPILEQMAKDGIRFDECGATPPWTVPSLASVFTAQWHVVTWG